jgi:hypothetical protein
MCAMKRCAPNIRMLRAMARVLLTALLLWGPAAAAQTGWPPPPDHYRLEHPQHRLAYWYANESMRQSQQAREMVCGFTGQHWTLDWQVHYRWALRASPRRVYRQVEDRGRHLDTCRSRKLNQYRRDPYRRGPGGYGRG